MLQPLLSVLLMGMIPVWGLDPLHQDTTQITIAAPTSATGSLRLERSLTASGVIVVDLGSAQTLFARQSTTVRPMASLTKLMTALIIIEHHRLSEVVTVPSDIEQTPGSTEHLPPGQKFTVGDLLSALLISSSNDAAVTLARYHGGSVRAFAKVMNERAKVLGLKHTSYENPVGLDSPLQRSTPHDLAWLAMFVLRSPQIAMRMGTPDTSIKSLSGKSIPIIHTHAMLHEDSFVIAGLPDRAVVRAGKTGTTDDAGQCLLSIVEVKKRRYVVVLLHSRDRYADMQRVLAALAHI